MTTDPLNIQFSFYGFGINVKCQDAQTLQNIRRDFSFFLEDNVSPRACFEILNEAPDYSKLPVLKASYYTPRNICYKQTHLTYIDYFGKGLIIIDQRTNIYKISCEDAHLRHEIIFLSILSLAGQDFDSKNIHRIHGLGLEIHNNAVLLLMPSGGGKTTLLLDLIKNDAVKLISEDSPLIDNAGNALPFPIRIGISKESKPLDFPDEQMHLIKRMEFGPKYVIDTAFLKDKLSTKPIKVRFILCGTRCLGMESSITPLSKYTAFKELFINSVVGIGVYQGLEFLLQHGIWGLIKKSGVVFSRIKNVIKILSMSRTYTFVLGCDRAKNVKTFLDFYRETV